jgi:hypothetical protein
MNRLVVRWMKAVVLFAGALGVLAFFLPFFEVQVGTQTVPAPAYRLAGFDGPRLELIETSEACAEQMDNGDPALARQGRMPGDSSCDDRQSHRTYVPLYFLSSAVLLIVGSIALIRRRMGGLLGLVTLAASMLAIGGWLRALRMERLYENAHVSVAVGATMLGISGTLAILASLVVLIWREPVPARKKPVIKPTLPEARIVR